MARRVIVSLDEGNYFFARYDDFVNLQVSPAGYGKSRKAALAALDRATLQQPYVDRRNIHHPQHWMVEAEPREQAMFRGLE